MKFDFTNKVVAITGAGGILCSAMATHLAKCHAKVCLLDIHEEAVKKLAEELQKEGYEAIGIYCNVLEEESIRLAHETIRKQFGRVNFLINGAGGNNPKATTDSPIFSKNQMGKEKTLFDISAKDFSFVFDINFTGTLLVTQEFAKDMIDIEDAAIINIASVNSFLPLTKIPAYSAAKEALSNFTKWLATYFSGVGIRVNAIAPGFLLTYQTKPLFYEEDGITPTKRLSQILEGTPMKRLGNPEELLGTICYLLDSDLSGFVTGAILPVDGGYTAYSGV
ncbi:MAG: SDR family oxidoreductase [Peptoniphilaceae bacterium]|nr:SDR family oxidoreductase [Peptoniphilaceae bacterium]MCI6660228.1 SDR family oxidoreductase [Peptoniphilaceae bacterium]MDD7542621.1 SDR family oxidoreductase [Peptoniphilaceae bacterium]MDY3987532.1 SDR family oxidoreductase [Peptoniphilaceae bacterium]MDY5766291.1 SDR family oxidoreductase [Peptoniphilaceae bacterium]